MKILYYEERKSKKYWDTLQSKNPDIEFEAVDKRYVPRQGIKIVAFIHFRAAGQQDRFEKEFNFHILGKDYEVPEDATVIFGPDRPDPILGSDFNTYLRKHKEEFKDADLVTIKRNDKVARSSMHGYNACKQLLARRIIKT